MIALDGFRPEFLDESWSDTIPNIHRLGKNYVNDLLLSQSSLYFSLSLQKAKDIEIMSMECT